jgi:hypothetical protein
MSDYLVMGPGDKPTKRYEPIEPEGEPQEPVEPDGGSPDSENR